jgi:hypothetical protein
MTDFEKNSSDRELEMDAQLAQALKDFRSSVHAWSEAAYGRPHHPVKVYRTTWRVVASWALGCVLAAGSLGGGFYEHHHRQEMAKIAADAEAARLQKLAAERRAQKENEDLLAKVDSDISRDVPSAMEPLAQLMSDDEPQ